jgi:hypothetical protein
MRDLVEFAVKCETFSRLANVFAWFISDNEPRLEQEQKDAWRAIFRRPLVYPLPEDHLLNQKPTVPDILPRPTEG